MRAHSSVTQSINKKVFLYVFSFKERTSLWEQVQHYEVAIDSAYKIKAGWLYKGSEY